MKSALRTSAMESSLDQKKIDLLLIEDSPSDAKLFQTVLSRAADADRFTVAHCKRLAKALKHLNREHFDVVILDLHLPDAQGLESVEELRHANPHIPIVVLTGIDDQELSLEALRRGAQDYIVKGTVDGDVLSEALRYAIERHRLVSDLVVEKEENSFFENHDHLTGLPNRSFLLFHLEHALAQARYNSDTVALIYIDIANFKSVNDHYGHTSGDAVLRLLANRLERLHKAPDFVARIGGDEFAIVLSTVKKISEVGSAAEEIIGSLSQAYVLDNQSISLPINLGISLFPQDEREPSPLLSSAEFAMLQAKQMGDNQYCYFSPKMNVKAQEKQELEERVRKALQSGELEAYYQPEFEVATGKVTALQALVRWRHPQLGTVPARFFILPLEQSQVVSEINRWLIATAAKQLNSWKQSGIDGISVSINVAAADLNRQEDFLASVSDTLEKSGVEASKLRFEVRENQISHQQAQNLSFLRSLRKLGTHIVLDGFGSGQSSMTQLSKLPISFLKIDKSLVNQIALDTETQGMVKAIIELARAHEIETIAEGIETKDQYQSLQALGCDRAQGFYLGKPASPEAASLIVRARL